MIQRLSNLFVALFLMCILVACGAETQQESEAQSLDTQSDTEKPPVAQGPVNPEFTLQLENQLQQSTLALSDTEREQAELEQTDLLENLTEADRQRLIDQTLEETSTQAEEDAEKVLQAIENAVESTQ